MRSHIMRRRKTNKLEHITSKNEIDERERKEIEEEIKYKHTKEKEELHREIEQLKGYIRDRENREEENIRTIIEEMKTAE